MRMEAAIVDFCPKRIDWFLRFLDLTASEPNSFFVPTVDIDLAWHTHQLNSKRYASDCKTYVGYYIDQLATPFAYLNAR